jgi:hypothetical protein
LDAGFRTLELPTTPDWPRGAATAAQQLGIRPSGPKELKAFLRGALCSGPDGWGGPARTFDATGPRLAPAFLQASPLTMTSLGRTGSQLSLQLRQQKAVWVHSRAEAGGVTEGA